MSQLEVLDAPTRLAGAILHTAGIANVSTADRLRGRGYASALMEHSHRFLAAAGYSTAALFDVSPGFYGQFGYGAIGANFILELDTNITKRHTPPQRIRAACNRDLPAVAELYNATNEGLDGSIVRNPQTWNGLQEGSTLVGTKGLSVAVDSQDQTIGFIAIAEQPGQTLVVDAGFRDPGIALPLISYAATHSVRQRIATVQFCLHPEFGLGNYVRRLGGRMTSDRRCNSGYMIRVLDQDAVLSAIAPALRSRAASHTWKTPADLCITTPTGTTTVKLRPCGDKRDISLPCGRLAQLLFGHDAVAELSTAEDVEIANRDAPWLAKIFPKHDAFCYKPDAY